MKIFVKIKLEDLIKVLSNDAVEHTFFVENNFRIDNDTEYNNCWIGKMADRDDLSEEIS